MKSKRTQPLSIQDALTEATEGFADEVLRFLSQLTVQQLTLLGVRTDAARRPSQAPMNPQPSQTRPMRPPRRLSAVRRSAGTKPVACPVPGCAATGVRAKMNFCPEHADSIPRAERERLRSQQRVQHRMARS